jgi:invasion protein IalB
MANLTRLPILLASFLCLSTPLLAQNATSNGTVFGDWRLSCQATAVNETACSIAQTLTIGEQNNFLVEITLQEALIENTKKTIMAVSTPTNMNLTAQPGYRVGKAGETRALTWRTCNAKFCTASRLLGDDEVASLRAGTSFVLGYHPIANKEPLVFQISLKGVSAGLNVLAK